MTNKIPAKLLGVCGFGEMRSLESPKKWVLVAFGVTTITMTYDTKADALKAVRLFEYNPWVIFRGGKVAASSENEIQS